MNNKLDYQNTAMKILLTEEEFGQFEEKVRNIGEKYQDVLGILITGSFVQDNRLPRSLEPVSMSPQAKHYFTLHTKKNRKLGVHPLSDLDVWVCTKDQYDTETITNELDKRAIAVFENYLSQPEQTTEQWLRVKEGVFEPFYKQSDLYSRAWQSNNGKEEPWMAYQLREDIKGALKETVPEIEFILNEYFEHKSLDNFLELRAYPTATFNLRPQNTTVKGVDYRQPMPAYIKDLVNRENNCLIMYSANDQETPYPFKEKGRQLGDSLRAYLGWTEKHQEYMRIRMKGVTHNEPYRETAIATNNHI